MIPVLRRATTEERQCSSGVRALCVRKHSELHHGYAARHYTR